MPKTIRFQIILMLSWLLFVQLSIRLFASIRGVGINDPTIQLILTGFYPVTFIFGMYLGWQGGKDTLNRLVKGLGLVLGACFAFIWGMTLKEVHYLLLGALIILIIWTLRTKNREVKGRVIAKKFKRKK